MSLFSRKKQRPEDSEATDVEATDVEAEVAEDGTEPAEAPPTGRGPWDVDDDDAPDLAGRVDLGAVVVPARPGMQLRMELDKKTRRVIAANITLGATSLQVQAFAAPRTAGLWDEIRTEIAESIREQEGTVDDVPGPFGRELIAKLPFRSRDGRTGTRPARFLGVDGPRWFVRGVVTGAGVADEAAAADIEAYFADVVVVRGSEARPPRELLALHVPGKAESAIAPAPDAGLEMLRRGPEITEVR
ncbi:conserved hypothetical protein [Beutenbergia cavernae DSM 12333]|uniref:DUF3710 domain-containing protein n=1 Tax=Beutenbergia cavernae (strain ATCC BAA-8 / DSM 12333 / CCUG 43141 / JCM 11478 / NBRC 16432 / NCIMB 13614 / HKI 0122) TaxID=471853 RepID=C5C5K3_BEUC1|nr:DUF3710 domain-containing protein [Beutenbergia cavernae]ACQ80194.1 conserved hypothetical protein [Beutenbergia cavernae DSM 12333]